MNSTSKSPWRRANIANSLEETVNTGTEVYTTGEFCEKGHQSSIRVLDGKCSACVLCWHCYRYLIAQK